MNTRAFRLVVISLGIGLGLLPVWAGAAKSKFSASEWAEAAKGKTIDFAVYKGHLKAVFTPGNAVGGGLIDDVTRPDGGATPLPDTAYLLANKLNPRLLALVGARWNKIEELLPLPVPKDKNVASYQAKYTSDFVLELSVPKQTLTYKPLQWGTYRPYIYIESRLIDNKSSTVLWKYGNNCNPSSDDGRYEIQNNQFAANDGKRLKELLAAVIDVCADEFMRDFTGDKPASKK